MKEKILEGLPNPVIIYDEDWNVNQINRPALEFLGYENSDQLTGKNIHALFTNDSLPDISEIQEKSAHEHVCRPRREMHHLHSGGHPVKILAHFSKIESEREKGKIKYVESGLPFYDILDWHHREMEKLQCYKTLAENVPGLDMFLIDKRYNIKCSVGSETHRQGWAPPDSEQKNLFDYFLPEIVRMLRPLLKIAFESTPVSREFEAGNDFYSVRLIPLISDDMEMCCVIILQNITDTKLVEEKLKISKKEADEANKAKGNFIAKMSHEIRTPLNAIIGFSEQLSKTRLTRKQIEFLEVIHNSSEHLLSIIDEILILSKIDSRQITFEKIPFKISRVLKAVKDLMELKYKEKGLEYKTLLDLSLDEVVVGDPGKLRQILINLVSNAIKFTEKGRIVLKAAPIRDTIDMLTVRFEISDTGIGIEQKDLQKIFKPFQQVDNTIGRNYSGTGLGLTISKDLVEKQGGRLTAKSTPGKGSTFAFTMTFNKTDKAEMIPEQEKLSRPRIPLNHLNILFVDDDPVNRMLGKVILNELQIKTDFAGSGDEAISLFEPGKYDIILLDINMPGINGLDVAYHIRNVEGVHKLKGSTKIIAMTANVMKSHIEQYMKAGMDDIILKPFKENNVYEKLSGMTSQIETFTTEDEQKQESIEEFNLDELLRITKGDSEFFLLMIDSFIENSTTLLKDIKTAFDRDDYPAIAESAHRLLPSMEQLGIKKASGMIRKIENKYLRKEKYNKDPDLIKAAVDDIANGIRLIKNAKSNFLKQM
ncbi:MAG: ATP-binding protein [Bacteroidales bacterium]